MICDVYSCRIILIAVEMQGRMLFRVAYRKFTGPVTLTYQSPVSPFTFLEASAGLEELRSMQKYMKTPSKKLQELISLM